MYLPAEGMVHVLVNGQSVISNGQLDTSVAPGRPIMRSEMTTPVLVVTGFLGAGKTTFTTPCWTAQGRRIAAIVNDFGAINIDPELIAGRTDTVVGLKNGCICCSLQGDLCAR